MIFQTLTFEPGSGKQQGGISFGNPHIAYPLPSTPPPLPYLPPLPPPYLHDQEPTPPCSFFVAELPRIPLSRLGPFTPSVLQSLTPSLPHSHTPSLPHSLTPSLPHFCPPSLFTPSLLNSLTHSLNSEILLSFTLTLHSSLTWQC